MKKTAIGKDAYYHIAWSPVHKYDKYSATRIVPDLAGIFCLLGKEGDRFRYLIFYSCWRDGCRVGLKKFLDQDMSKHIEIVRQLDFNNLYFRFTVIEESLKDMQDIMYWLVQTYSPEFNNAEGIQDSKRYASIYLKETEIEGDSIIERL
ncbi:MAG: hypothetical protein MUD12_04120 [Spirochaetes bacterium]|jgi:hypothetical protein|nr:hypothetical protein [Spirochaetota bacterium]